jgi:hypothetical protein
LPAAEVSRETGTCVINLERIGLALPLLSDDESEHLPDDIQSVAHLTVNFEIT